MEYQKIREIVDGKGVITKENGRIYLIITEKRPVLFTIIETINIDGTVEDNDLIYKDNNALDFLHLLYENHQESKTYNKYHELCHYFEPKPFFRYCKDTKYEKVFDPSKTRASDSGYDLTIIHKLKQSGMTSFYDTGISIQPDFGWYAEVYPRSSLSKTGYMLANSVGIIDRSYRGNIIVALIKIDNTKPDLELPFRAVQIIFKPVHHLRAIEMQKLEKTERDDKGFGSTNEKSN